MILTWNDRFLKLLHFLTVVFSWQILPSMQSSPWNPLEHPRGHWPVTWWHCSPYKYKQLPQVSEQASPYLLSVHSKEDNKHVLYQMSYHVKSFLFDGESESWIINILLLRWDVFLWVTGCCNAKPIHCFVMHSSGRKFLCKVNPWNQQTLIPTTNDVSTYEECIKQKVHRPHPSPEIHCLAINKPLQS